MSNTTFEDVLTAIREDLSTALAEDFSSRALEFSTLAASGEGSPTKAYEPSSIAEQFSEPAPMLGNSIEYILRRIDKDIIPNAVRFHHPKYLAVNVGPPLPVVVWAETLVAAMNQSLRVFSMSPSGTTVEMQVIRWLNSLVGFGEHAGGTFTSGGTESNFTALLAARAHTLPEAWEHGLQAPLPLVICGDEVHYSVTRTVAQLGLGQKQVRRVPHRALRMDPIALARTLQDAKTNSETVMAVVATAGTMTSGAFDNLEAIASICEEFQVWLHVDGAHGGSALLSSTHRERLKGVERAHSLTWDMHKMMLMPLPASAVLFRDGALLDAAFPGNSAMMQTSWNRGMRSFMASRRADALKVWIAFQRYGIDGLGCIYDHFCNLAHYTSQHLLKRDGFELVQEPDCNVVCFSYVGQMSSASKDDLSELNLQIHRHMRQKSDAMIVGVRINGHVKLRLTFMSPFTTEQHIVEVLDEIERVGQELTA